MLEEYKTNRAVWEKNYDGTNIRSDVLVRNRAIAYLGEVAGKRVLDLGTGNGKVARALAKKGALVTGIDVSPEQLRFAQGVEDEKKLGITYLQADITRLEKLELPFDSYDIVLSFMVHLYLPKKDFEESFKKIIERTVVGGRFIYGNTHPARILFDDALPYNTSKPLTVDLPTMDGKVFTTQYYHHTLADTVNPIIDAGFAIEKILEPTPTTVELKKYEKIFPVPDQSPRYIILDCKRA